MKGRKPFFLNLSPNSSAENYEELDGLFQSHFPPQVFSWQAALLAEKLVKEEGIDIIEAQEFQAPLYYFQLRRAIGLGPKLKPPCIVHLHSPTEFIAQHNNWDINFPFYQTAKRLEDYTIGAADALLCPSRYFARRAESHYRLPLESVSVIPLPVGETPFQERDASVWKSGSLCYVGRLEERKGVVEWIDAAVSVADKFPDLKFEFIGANCLGTQRMSAEEFINQRIPQLLRPRFIFKGNQERSKLPEILKQARIAVIPSRWENFPNTCVEAMSSGLPVLASREGGMVEMIEDGKTGWLATEPGVDGLRTALIRAVTTDPAMLVAMGTLASQRIREKCNNQNTLEEHLAYRTRIAKQGAQRLAFIPAHLPTTKLPLSQRQQAININASGIVVIISFPSNVRFLKSCLSSLKNQSLSPLKVILLINEATSKESLDAFEQVREPGWEHMSYHSEVHFARLATVKKFLENGLNPNGVAFISEGDFLHREFIEVCDSSLKHNSHVGIVSCWTKYLGTRDKYWMPPCPAFPYQWINNEVAPFAVMRMEALRETSKEVFSDLVYTNWNFSNSLMANGWVALTVPKILSTSLSIWDLDFSHIESPHLHALSLKKIYGNLPNLFESDLQEILMLAISKETWTRSTVFTRVKSLLNKTEILFFYSKSVFWYLSDKLFSQAWNKLVSVKRKILK